MVGEAALCSLNITHHLGNNALTDGIKVFLREVRKGERGREGERARGRGREEEKREQKGGQEKEVGNKGGGRREEGGGRVISLNLKWLVQTVQHKYTYTVSGHESKVT